MNYHTQSDVNLDGIRNTTSRGNGNGANLDQGQNRLKVLFVSPEVSPLAKTGGLADVSGSLPKALARLGADVRICMPRYKQIEKAQYVTDLAVDMDGHFETAVIRQTQLPVLPHAGANQPNHRAVPVYLVDNYRFFYRDGLYGFPDEGERYDFFCKATLSMLPRINFKPDVIHTNDWQSALIPLYLRVKHQDEPFYQDIATVFTIHNLQYQGHFPKEILRLLGLSDAFFTPDQLEFYGRVNFMKAGIIWADVVNTVSPKYALEIQTADFGEGLDGLLRKRGKHLYGILNGIDFHEFDPATDPRIIQNYSWEDPDKKVVNKNALQEEMGLPVKNVPVVSIISRLANQKGLDLVAGIINRLIQAGAQFVLLGTGEDYYQRLFTQLQLQHRESVAVHIGFDANLAQRIYAGADIFLMPSRFEPCGLSQMISMRYGTIPVVRATGGLEDTVIDVSLNPKAGNGFTFREYSANALWEALDRALHMYRQQPDQWRQLMVRAMQANYSWEKSAARYLDLYRHAISDRRLTAERVG
ncbi:MAG: glycogen synthase GlgA [Clostridia bacterium]|nr:glycogen synthase GlgA [Clostridia bacterium]